MAWTTPKTWASGDVLTAADMNTYVRDNANALYGTLTSYTPTLAQGASTNISKTVTEARYIQTGRVVDVWVFLSITAAGTGGSNVTVTLPIAGSGATSQGLIGTGMYQDTGTASYGCTVHFDGASTVILRAYNATGYVGLSPALTVASGDALLFHVRYPV